VEVVSGITDADRVIVSPPDSLVDGEEVKIAQPNQQGGSGNASPQPQPR
jgi:hypothetical protein